MLTCRFGFHLSLRFNSAFVASRAWIGRDRLDVDFPVLGSRHASPVRLGPHEAAGGWPVRHEDHAPRPLACLPSKCGLAAYLRSHMRRAAGGDAELVQVLGVERQ